MNLFFANIFIAIIWVALSANPSVNSFIVGFIVGFIMTAIFQSLFKTSRYPLRLISFVTFIFYFIKAFILANLSVVHTVLLKKREDINPNIISYDVTGLSETEVLILSHCITLTPGTTTIDYTGNTLYLHALDASDPEAVRKSIKVELLTPMLGFTR